MSKKMITHGLVITAFVIAAFVAAAFTPSKTYAKTSEGPAVINIAKIDHENRTLHADSTVIADNEVPLAATPYEGGMNAAVCWAVVAASAIITGIVIFEDIKA